jgi:hypothetical protein
MSDRIPIPRHLSKSTRQWVRQIIDDYSLESHHLKILFSAGEALDRIGQARAQIERDGSYFTDRFGAPRPHPGLQIERDNRVCFVRMLRELNLSEDAPEARPASLKYGGR